MQEQVLKPSFRLGASGVFVDLDPFKGVDLDPSFKASLGGRFHFYFFCFGGGETRRALRDMQMSRKEVTPHCLAAIFDSQLPSLKLSLKMPLKLPFSPRRDGFFPLLKIATR